MSHKNHSESREQRRTNQIRNAGELEPGELSVGLEWCDEDVDAGLSADGFDELSYHGVGDLCGLDEALSSLGQVSLSQETEALIAIAVAALLASIVDGLLGGQTLTVEDEDDVDAVRA